MLSARTIAAGVLALGLASTEASAAPVLFGVTAASSRTGDVQSWTVPEAGDYRITALGASGGRGGGAQNYGFGGRGASAEGIFTLAAGDQLNILVGASGQLGTGARGGGGGGGSFIFFLNGLTPVLLVAAGGGGGGGAGVNNLERGVDGRDASLSPNGTAGTGASGGAGGTAGSGGSAGMGSGGGGLSGAGAGAVVGGGGSSILPTATGGTGGLGSGTGGSGNGGFGGGGGAGSQAGGGGGGFSGGGGGGSGTASPNLTLWDGGGGGGSLVNAFFGGFLPGSAVLALRTEEVGLFGYEGLVRIEFLGRGGGQVAVPAPGGLAVLALALFGLAAVRRRA